MGSTESEFVTSATFERIESLFQKATRDYLSIDVYLKWADFMEKVMVESLEADQSTTKRDSPQIGFEEVRSFYEHVISQVKGHLSRSGQIWERYRGFVDMMASCMSDSDQTEFVRLKRELFHREIAHPHLNLAKMFAETYIPWEKEIGSTQAPLNASQELEIKQAFESSWTEVEARMAYEVELQTLEEAYSDLHTPDYERLDGLRKYIQFETTHAHPNPDRIVCLYERTLAMYFLVIDLWQSYSQYLLKAPSPLSNLEILEAAISVQERAIRNYPYTHHMWCQLMISMEKRKPLLKGPEASQTTRREITNIFEKALQGGLQSGTELLLVYKQYLDYRVRAVENWSDDTQVASIIALLESARTYFASYLPDLVSEVEKYWADVALFKLKNVEQARAVYELGVRGNPSSTQSWLYFIQFEQQVANHSSIATSDRVPSDSIRGVFKRAIASELDAPETIWNLWLDFERLHGDLDSFSLAIDKIEKKQRDWAQKQAGSRQAAYAAAGFDDFDGAQDGNSRKRKQQQQSRKEKRSGGSGKKQNVSREMRDPAAKKFAKDKNGDAVASNASIDQSQYAQDHQRGKKPTPNFDPVTLHVGGVPTSENLGPADIASLFTPFGEVAEVRFPRNAMGQLKGFVFVQFKNPESSKEVRNAIKNEKRTFEIDFEGKPHKLRVTAAVALKPSKPKPVPGMEEFKHTVFVSNLSALTTQAQLEEFIRTIGAPVPVAVRMPTDRKTGASRCIAYLDFDEESLVQKSADIMKDKFLDGRRLKAAPSAPTKERPMRPTVDQDASAPSTSLGSLGGRAAQEAERHAANSASQSAKLVPRSVAMRQQQGGGHQRMRMNLVAKASSSSAEPASSSSQMDTS
jgi:RNA recognition motif-containing protein